MLYIRFSLIFVITVTGLLSTASYAKGTYQKPEAFLNQAFEQQVPEPGVIWIRDQLRQDVEKILQHRFKGQRTRYWKKGKRSVWILEEIGKKKPITVGIIIDDNQISQLKVLVFRETRGWEVRYPFFTKQFKQAALTPEHRLNTQIDGISGATLSVRALRKLARIALLLNQQLQANS